MKGPLLLLAFLPLLAGSAQAQTLGHLEGEPGISLWRVLTALSLCLALAVVAAFALRRRFGTTTDRLLHSGTRERRIRVIEQQYLGPQRSLYLLAIDGEEFVCLFAAHTATLVQRATDRPPATQARAVP